MVMQFIKDPFGIKRRRKLRERIAEVQARKPVSSYGAKSEDLTIRHKLATEHQRAFASGATQKGERFSQRPGVRDTVQQNDSYNPLLDPLSPLNPASPMYNYTAAQGSHPHRADDCAPSTNLHSHTHSHSFSNSGSSCGGSDDGGGGGSDGGGGGGAVGD